MTMPFALILSSLFLTASTELWAQTPLERYDRQIRVLIREDDGPFRLKLTGGGMARDLYSGRTLMQWGPHEFVEVQATAQGLAMGRGRFQDPVSLEASGDVILVAERNYKGKVVLHPNAQSGIKVVNHLDVEDYLAGVIMNEVGVWWPMSSLKAQAVAARTYALYHKKTGSNRIYDLKDNQSSQVYGGMNSVRDRTLKAVQSTRGEALVYDGNLIPAFYHSTCGGVTSDAKDVWNMDIPPLTGGIHCTTCWFSPHYRWRVRLKQNEVAEKLKKRSQKDIGEWSFIENHRPAHSLRLTGVTIRGPQGEETLEGNELRDFFGGYKLKSDRFTLSLEGGDLVIEGRGWGHGVGLCQWGALGLALGLKKYEEILSFYYPGARLKRLYD